MERVPVTAVLPHGRRSDLAFGRPSYTQWLTTDKHAKAYEVLLKARSMQMAKNLKMTEPPSKSDRCLVCHALEVPKELRSASYKIEDGVGCETCHGQAEGWLGIHIAHRPRARGLVARGHVRHAQPGQAGREVCLVSRGR